VTQRLLAAVLSASVFAGALATLSARSPQAGTISRQEIALAADRIRADRWYDDVMPAGSGQTMRQNRNADMNLLLLGLKQPFPEIRAAALRELGRFGVAANAALLASYLNDPVASVKRAAANAVVQTLWDKTPLEAADAVQQLDLLAQQERAPAMMSALWNAIAELPLDAAMAQKYEERFINEIRQVTDLRLSALSALVKLAEHRRGREFMASTEEHVKDWARKGLDEGNPDVMVGTLSLGPTLAYLEILQAVQADADDIAASAARFVCRRSAHGCGAAIRRFGVDLLNSANPSHIPVLLEAARDRTDVRAAAAAIRSLIKSTAVTRCELIDIAEKTPAEVDVIAALAEDAPDRNGECGDWSPAVRLTQQASTLMAATRGTDWVVPSAALEALARIKPDVARPIAEEVAASHQVWQVRVTAARVARTLKDSALAAKLAADANPNVAATAIDALVGLQSGAVWKAAAAALVSDDYHLVRTAAFALKGAPDPGEALIALFDSLRRLTDAGRDTSRRARLALLDRIGELLPGGAPDSPGRDMQLRGLLRDFDPLVARAAAEFLRNTSSSPIETQPAYRVAYQPSATRLLTLPPCALITLESEGILAVVLNRTNAPVAVARFLEAAERGHYTDSLIYRDDDNLTVFGNPAAHDEGGWPRFARDEPGTPVRPLSLTMLSHGPDTADGRLAIRWRVYPELDRRETVIGRAYPSRGALVGLQLGKRIEKIVAGGGVDIAIGEGRSKPGGSTDPCNPLTPW
jgi:peptidyl-prolyl cis-trans isomerase B (cyclophilin B)